jgi:2-C-methyl-D-erythritol 4-phosphate cytidylyltransferase
MNSYAIVLASGGGLRFGASDMSKHLTPINGIPMIVWTVEAIIASNIFDKVIVVTAVDSLQETRGAIGSYFNTQETMVSCVAGAEERMHSFSNGYFSLTDSTVLNDDDVVVLIDANRPFVESAQLTKIVYESSRVGCACLARPVVNGVAKISGTSIVEVPEKSQYVEFVTPEGILNKSINTLCPTDDFSLPSLVDLALSLDIQPRYIAANERNSKLTYPEDLPFFERLQKKYQITPPLLRND